MLVEQEVPLFTNAIAAYPDMVLGDSLLGFFAQNDFNFNSHKVILFDTDLTVKSELYIDGPSDLYSGQITSHGEDFFVAHVHSGELDFNGEIILPYTGTGERPYIAKIGDPVISNVTVGIHEKSELNVSPNPANNAVRISYGTNQKIEKLDVYNLQGELLISILPDSQNIIMDISSLPPGLYIFQE